MLVLGIDTSNDTGAIGLINDGDIAGEININLARRHSERLLPDLDFLFQESGYRINEVQGIGVTVGPGSFTGLRIGLSTARTFAQVLDIPLVGISTLDLIAYNLNGADGWLVPIIDAGRERVYTSLYRKWQQDIRAAREWPDQALKLTELIERLNGLENNTPIFLVGDGVKAYHDQLLQAGSNLRLTPGMVNMPRGAAVAELARFYLSRGDGSNYLEVLPNYLKKPQAEINWLRKHG